MILKTRTPLSLLDADARRVLVTVGRATIAVYASNGSLLRTIRLPATHIIGGALVGNEILVLRPGALDRFAPGNNKPVRSYPTAAGAGQVSFHGVASGIAVYTVGAILHAIRLSDGIDVALWAKGLTNVTAAVPTPAGLITGLQLERPRSGGMVGIVRWSDVF
jgi:hypothetical protein